MKSWRTTALGILSGLVILITQAIAALDSDPETVFNLEAVMAAFALMGIGVAARDNVVSSEQAGAKALLLVCLLLPAVGCSGMSPTQQYAFHSNGFAATVDQVTTLVEFGVIEDDDLKDIHLIAKQIDTEFDAWEEALRNDIPLDSRFVLARVERLLGRLVQYQLDAEQGVFDECSNSTRMGTGSYQGWLEGGGSRTAGASRGARPDRRGVGSGQGDPQRLNDAFGRRDQIASRLRGIGHRYADLAVIASR